MRARHAWRTVLVPIFGDVISDDAYAAATSLLGDSDARLVLLHVMPAAPSALVAGPGGCQPVESKWHRLASAAPGHTFVDAVVGDPVDEVLAEAQRFDSDAIVLDPPASAAAAEAWIHRAIAELTRAAPRRVCLASPRERPRRATRSPNRSTSVLP